MVAKSGSTVPQLNLRADGEPDEPADWDPLVDFAAPPHPATRRLAASSDKGTIRFNLMSMLNFPLQTDAIASARLGNHYAKNPGSMANDEKKNC